MWLIWLFGHKHSELKLVLAGLGLLLLMPMIAVVVIVSTGSSLVSAAVATVNPISHEITIYGPTGAVQQTVLLSTIWPTDGYVSSEFGAYEAIRQELRLGAHTGIDIANAYDVPVRAFLSGSVTQVDRSGAGSCGKYIRLQHAYDVTSLYCHLSDVQVSPGDTAEQGQVIGLMGSTGASSGPHLHFQVAVHGVPVNPRTFIPGEPERGSAYVPLAGL